MGPKIWPQCTFVIWLPLLCTVWTAQAKTSCPLTGSRPSPVNIVPKDAQPIMDSVLIDYKVWNMSQIFVEQSKDHGSATLRFEGAEGGGSLQVGESFSNMDEYVLRRLRVAMPSEHTLLNRRFPIEVQLWHEPAIHRDISMLISDRKEVQQMLRRFQQLTKDWQGELQQLEDPSQNESFPDLQTEQDWAESVRQHTVKDGRFLMKHVKELQQRISDIDAKVERLNERLHRPESARVVALSLFYWTPHNIAFPGASDFLKWLSQATAEVGTLKPPLDNQTTPKATEQLRKQVEHLQELVNQMQHNKSNASKASGWHAERQLRGTAEIRGLKDFNFEDSVQRKETLTAFAYEGSFTRPPCTPVVRWFVVAEPQPATAKDLLSLASSLLQPDHSTQCQQAEGLEVCGPGIQPSDGVWWRGSIKQTPESKPIYPSQPMRTISLGFGSFHKPKETHLSSQLVSQLPWPYVQACCAVLLLCSVAMLGTTCSMWSHQCCNQ